MSTSKILCLANSYKENNRCVAGIDLQTGQLVRPVAKTDSQAIPSDWTEVSGRSLKPLDIVEVPFLRGDATTKYQAENRFCDKGWKIGGQAKLTDLQRYCDSDRTILHTPGSDAIHERYFRLQKRSRQTWQSLQLIQASDVQFYKREEEKWNGRFKNRAGQEFDFRVTDDRFVKQLAQKRRGKTLANGYLLLSLSRPWKHYQAAKDRPMKCYKLIAGVISST